MSEFANEVILITGAASGLGRGMARRLAAEGAVIAAIDRNPVALAALEKDLDGQRIAGAVADVTDAAAMVTAIRDLEAKLGPTDRLIANAGIGRATGCHQFSAADFGEIINVNLLGVANSVAAVLPGMIERKKGHLVALSSLASFRGLPLMSAYCASKAGVSALFDSLAVELRAFNIVTTTICPGWIRTPLTEAIKFRMPNLLEIDEAVGRILNAVRRKKRFVAFPWKMALMLRTLRWIPTALGDRLVASIVKEDNARNDDWPAPKG